MIWGGQGSEDPWDPQNKGSRYGYTVISYHAQEVDIPHPEGVCK